MQEYRQGSHTKFSIHLHVVWVTKYRKSILQKEIALYVRDVIRKKCRKNVTDEVIKAYIENQSHDDDFKVEY